MSELELLASQGTADLYLDRERRELVCELRPMNLTDVQELPLSDGVNVAVGHTIRISADVLREAAKELC